MLEIIDLKIDCAFGEIRRLPVHADVVDIAVVFGDHLRDLRKRAGLVDRLHLDARGEPFRRALVTEFVSTGSKTGRVYVNERYELTAFKQIKAVN